MTSQLDYSYSAASQLPSTQITTASADSAPAASGNNRFSQPQADDITLGGECVTSVDIDKTGRNNPTTVYHCSDNRFETTLAGPVNNEDFEAGKYLLSFEEDKLLE